MEPEGADDDATFISSDIGFLTESFADGQDFPLPFPASLGAAEMSSLQKDFGSTVLEEDGTGRANLDGSMVTSPVECDARVREVNDIAPSREEDEIDQMESEFLLGPLEAVSDYPLEAVSDDPPPCSSNGHVVASAQDPSSLPPQLPSQLGVRVDENDMNGASNVIPTLDADTAMAVDSAGLSSREAYIAQQGGFEFDHSAPQISSSEDVGLFPMEVGSAARLPSPGEDGASVGQEQVSQKDNSQLPAATSPATCTSLPRSGNEVQNLQQTSGVQDGRIGFSPSRPVATEATVERAEDRDSDGAFTALASPGATVPPSNGDEPGPALDVDDANGAKSHSGLLVQAEVGQGDDTPEHDLQPAKRAKTSKTAYTGTDAVSVMLGQTAEMILVLAGMSQMRSRRPSTEYEMELASTAYRNLGVLVSRVAPSNLVAKESLERMVQDFDARRKAKKKRQEQAWIEAVTEAESLANARALAQAKAEAEAAAAAAAVAAAAAAKAQAESEELERRRQASLQAVFLGINGASNNIGTSSTGGAPLSSGHSVHLQAQPSTPVAGQHSVLPNQMNSSQQQVSVSNTGEVPRSATPVKVTSVNGQSPAPPPSKGHPGRPPKARNRARKEQAMAALSAPDYLSQMQSQGPDSQKVQMTHKQLSLGVQQYIREHVPPVSQTQLALQPTYISTPYPCQVCKVIAEDTNSVLVCDSCDQVTHVKCVQPTPPKSAAKNDWNCRACLIASRGSKYPSTYGPVRRGSPTSVKLWSPHDNANSNSKAAAAIPNGSLNSLLSPADARKGTNTSLQSGQRKSNLEIDTWGQDGGHESTGATLGNSPHLVVHLVNEPSPKLIALPNSSHSLRGHRKRSSHSAPDPKFSTEPNTEERQEAPEGSLIESPTQRDMVSTSDAHDESSSEVDDNQTLATIAREGREQEQSGNVPVLLDKSRKGTQGNEGNEKTVRSGSNIAGKPGDIPLPIVMEWVGGSFRRADGKIYYRSCRVGGVTFSITDCALFRPETADVPPYIARLQVLWEDVETSHKWVRVSWCYYPSDIPVLMGRPGPTVPDEVYESNHCDNNLLGSIQGPCYVLPPMKFREEKERRVALRHLGNVDDLPPIFLSRYMYDAPKGIFRPLQE